jgi:hypothetical protein
MPECTLPFRVQTGPIPGPRLRASHPQWTAYLPAPLYSISCKPVGGLDSRRRLCLHTDVTAQTEDGYETKFKAR